MGVLDFFGREAGQRRRAALEEFGRSAEEYVPPELRPIVGLLSQMTPTAANERAAMASDRLFQPGRTVGQRVGDFGEMASEIAGVVAPVALAGRAGMPAAEALQEALMGFSAGSQQAGRAVVDRLNQPGPVPTMYSNPLMGAPASIDDQVEAARKAWENSSNDSALLTEYKRLRRMRDEGSSAIPQSEATAPQVNTGLLSDYVGQHRAPMRDEGAPAFDLAGDIYPDDIYSPKAVQYYGTGSNSMDRDTMDLLQSLRGEPDADVTIYRAVPKGVDRLNAGDWVTVNKQYALDHGEGALGGDFDIVERTVKAKDIFTNGDSIHEFGYDPSTPAQEVAGLLSSGRAADVTDEMLGKLTPKDEMELFELYQRGATGMDLPMDEASRMARAGDMGFGVEHPLYRGDTVDHPYYQALYDDAIYTSTDPRVSEDYALKRGLISPLIGNRDNFAIDSSFDDFDADGFSEALAGAYDSGKSGVNFQSVADGDAFSRHGKVIADTNAFLDPRDIRSRFARFDPRLAHLRNLSAGVGGLGLLGMSYPQEEQY